MTARLLTPTVLRGSKLAWWAAAFGIGAFAGYWIAFYPADPSRWGVLGVLIRAVFYVVWTGGPLAISGLVVAVSYRALLKGRLPSAGTVLAAAAFYWAGVGVGFVMTPVLGLEYRYQEPIAITPAASSPPTATAIAPAWVPPAVPAGAGWHRLPGVPMSSSSTWIDVLESTIIRSHGLDILVGNGEEPNIWSSADGVRWEAADGIDIRVDPDLEEQTMVGLASNGSALVAFGNLRGEATRQAVLWRSIDGRTWARVGDPSFPPGVRVDFVGGTSLGFIAFGFDPAAPEGQRARGWTSSDGSTWEPISMEVASAVASGLQLLANLDGVLTAFTNVDPAVGPLEVWQAEPGNLAKWQRVGSLGSEGWGFVAVAKGPAGWLAIGRAVYRSADGRAWSLVIDPSQPDSPTFPAEIEALIGDELGFIATTLVATGEGCAASGSLTMTWVSADGATWRQLPTDPQFENATVFGLISRAGVVLALGSSNLEDEVAPAIWIAERATFASGPDASPTPAPSSVGCGPE